MNIESYILHLLSSPNGNSCVKASEALSVSHDQVTRLLNNSDHSGRDLYAKAAPNLILEGGTLSLDDSVIDKPYSDLRTNGLVGYHWSGKHHKSVLGICLVALIYTDVNGQTLPVHFRIFDANGGQSKHQILRQMIRELIAWGLKPARFTADSWYAALENLKFLRNLEISFQIGLRSNRTVSSEAGKYEQVGNIEDIPESGLVTHLKGFDFVKVFRTVSSDGDVRHYAVYGPTKADLENYDYEEFSAVKQQHWQIEHMFRVLKQVCNLERFFVRKSRAVTNHIYAALSAFRRLTIWVKNELFHSMYALRKAIFIQAQRAFISNMIA